MINSTYLFYYFINTRTISKNQLGNSEPINKTNEEKNYELTLII